MAWPTGPIHGKVARVHGGTTEIDYTSRWSINWVKDAAVFGRQGKEYKEASPGQASWGGTIEFTFVRTGEQKTVMDFAISTEGTVVLTTAVTSSAIKFCFDSTLNYLHGLEGIIVTGLTVDAGVGDLVRGTLSFTGSGAINFSSVV